MSWFLESLPTSYSSLHLFFPSHFSSFSTFFLFISFFIIFNSSTWGGPFWSSSSSIFFFYFFQRNRNEIGWTRWLPQCSEHPSSLANFPHNQRRQQVQVWQSELDSNVIAHSCHNLQGNQNIPGKNNWNMDKISLPSIKESTRKHLLPKHPAKTQKTCHKYTRFPCPT